MSTTRAWSAAKALEVLVSRYGPTGFRKYGEWSGNSKLLIRVGANHAFGYIEDSPAFHKSTKGAAKIIKLILRQPRKAEERDARIFRNIPAAWLRMFLIGSGYYASDDLALFGGCDLFEIVIPLEVAAAGGTAAGQVALAAVSGGGVVGFVTSFEASCVEQKRPTGARMERMGLSPTRAPCSKVKR